MESNVVLSLVISGCGLLLSIGGTVAIISKFMGESKEKDASLQREIDELKSNISKDITSIKNSMTAMEEGKASSKDIQEIKSDIKEVFRLIREGGLHPTCLKSGEISSVQSQVTSSVGRMDRLELELAELRREYIRLIRGDKE